MPRKPSSSGLSDDPSIEFVNFLTTRTEEGRIKWNANLNVFETHLPVAVTAQFLTESTPLGGRTWRLFLLRDSRREELIRAFPTTDLTINPPVDYPNGRPPEMRLTPMGRNRFGLEK